MITIEDKLFITKEVNLVLYKYAKEIIQRELLYLYSFSNNPNSSVISELIVDISSHKGNVLPPELQHQLSDLVHKFIEGLTSEKQVALNFWVLNNLYLEFLDTTHVENETDTKEQFNQKFGRELAYKLYDPKNSGLMDDLLVLLTTLLIAFSSELDLSLIDENTSVDLMEIINNYCDHEGSITSLESI